MSNTYVPITATPSGGMGVMSASRSGSSLRAKFLTGLAMIAVMTVCIVGYSSMTSSSTSLFSSSLSSSSRSVMRAPADNSRAGTMYSAQQPASPFYHSSSRLSSSSRSASSMRKPASPFYHPSSRLSSSSRSTSTMRKPASPFYHSSSRLSSRMSPPHSRMDMPSSSSALSSRLSSPYSGLPAMDGRVRARDVMSARMGAGYSGGTMRNTMPRTMTGGRSVTTTSRESSNDCATTAKGACTGEVSSDSYTAVRQCSSENGVATQCVCFGRNAQLVSSELSGPRCYCDFAKTSAKKATWAMFLFCQ